MKYSHGQSSLGLVAVEGRKGCNIAITVESVSEEIRTGVLYVKM
jgi:hypothetical protein